MEAPERQPRETTSGAPRRLRRWGLRAGLGLCGLAAGLALAELLLRLIGFSYPLYPKEFEFGMPNPRKIATDFATDPDLYWVTKDYSTTLRDARENHAALIMLGCSCTHKGKLGEAFEQVAAEEQPDRKARVANFAVTGWSSYQGLQQLQRDVIPLSPKIVTIYFGWNDHWKGFGVEDREIAEISHSLLYKLQGKLRLAELAGKLFATHRLEQRQGPIVRVPKEDFRSNLIEMIRLCRSHNIVPVLLTAPDAHERGKEPQRLLKRHLDNLDDLIPLHQSYVEIVRDVARSQNAILCDLAKSFAELPKEELKESFMEDGTHFLPAGSYRASRFLYQTLAEHDLLPLVLD